MVTDRLADSVARIRNAQLAKHLKTNLFFSKKVFALIKLLCVLGYLKNFSVVNVQTEDVIYSLNDDKSYDIYHDKTKKYDFSSNVQHLAIVVELKYKYSTLERKPVGVIRDMALISTQGRRITTAVKDLKISQYKNGMGCVIVSTSKGLMDDKKAIQLNLGGEKILKVF